MSKPCPVESCDAMIGDHVLMCADCLASLTPVYRRSVEATFARHEAVSPAYQAAAKGAIWAASAAREWKRNAK